MKIQSPVTDYTGTQTYGETVLEFEDGVAEFDGDLNHGVRQYLLGAGYKVGSTAGAVVADAPALPDPREHTDEQVGTALRDAAVDPRPEDFLAPTNAGKDGPEGNPHGPHVVAPQIHASTGQPVVPGPVGSFEKDADGTTVVVSDTDAQERRETEFAERVLVGDEPAPDVLVDMGRNAEPAAADEVPAGNASTEAWRDYARTQGATDEDLDGKGRDELRDTYGPKA